MAVFKPSWLLYGATGYTGALVAAEAGKRGHNVILAGRSEAPLAKLGKQLDLPIRVFDMAARDQIDRGLTGVRLVLNCAGPFSLTASTLAQACMRTGAHYLDIAGEVADHRALHRLHERACESGVMLLPGVGFGILPSDCLAFHLKKRQPGAVKLTLAFSAGASASHGTMATLLESLRTSGLVRRAGQLVAAEPASESCTIDFGPGKQQRAILFPWRADVISAGLSTDIPHIQSFGALSAGVRFILKKRTWFESGPMRKLLERWVARAPAGPKPAERAKRKSWLYGEVLNEVGARACAVVEGPDPYDFTVLTALAAVERCLSGQLPDGYATPAQIMGDAPLRQLPGVTLHTIK